MSNYFIKFALIILVLDNEVIATFPRNNFITLKSTLVSIYYQYSHYSMLNNKKEAIKLYNKLLQEFESLPKVNTNPTFMELCHMRGDKFEERCSQILSFYFNPNAPHNLYGLLIKSLLDSVKIDIPYSLRDVHVRTEEKTPDRKFIDITIIGDNFVIAIENKIGADLYNPLDSYVSHIKECYKNKEYQIFIILSARRIADITEIKKIERHDYLYVNYFHTVRRNKTQSWPLCN